MSRAPKHYYVTTPIYYVNAAPHIGHAYTSIAADVAARWRRLRGDAVNFLTGTDEHGQKIARAAAAAGMAPQKYVDGIAATFQKLNAALEISNTDFLRTTEARHIAGAQKFWRAAAAAGDIYKKKYEGLYCVACEQFYLEKEIGAEHLCPVHATALETLAEENYFFRLSRYTEALKKHFDAHPDFIFPAHRQREMRQILEDGLEDISISRSRAQLAWGIPVPDDDTQVMYVWFDALTNYVTAIGYSADDASDAAIVARAENFETWWPANAHVMAKEINRFHSLLWPAMLMSAFTGSGQKSEKFLPEKIVVHGWLTVDGKKMSKTTGNVVDPFAAAEKYGADALRYFLLRELPFGEDGDFSFAKLEARYKSDLQHDFGNLVQRAIAMSIKFCDGATPQKNFRSQDNSAAHQSNAYENLWPRYAAHMDAWEFQAALDTVWEQVRALNQLIDREKPWELARACDDSAAGLIAQEKIHAVLYTVLEGVRHIALALQPFMPAAAQKIFDALGFEFFDPNFDKLTEWGLLKSGAPLDAPIALFPPLQ